MALTITPPAIVPQRPISPDERPSRWRLTYAVELQILPAGGTTPRASVIVNLAMNPSRIDETRPGAVSITPSVGGLGVDQRGFVRGTLQVEGEFGIKAKSGWTPGRLEGGQLVGGGITLADGNTLWRELRRVFELWDSACNDPSITPRLVWHDFRNDDHWLCTLLEWSMPRDAAQYRVHYPYSFKLEIIGAADASGVSDEARIFQIATDAIAVAIGAINAVSGVVADVGAFVDTVDSTIRTAIFSTAGALQGIIDGGQGIVDGVRDVMDIPATAVEAARGLLDSLVALVDDVMGTSPWSPTSTTGSTLAALYATAGDGVDALDSLLAQPSLFSDDPQEEQARFDQQRAGVARLSDEEVAAAPASAFDLAARATPGSASRRQQAQFAEETPRAPGGATRYVVKRGDDIESVAARELGGASRWPEIARLNDLSHPYIAEARRPGGAVAVPGDEIWLPSTGVRPAPPAEDDPLGQDIDAAWIFRGTDGGLDAVRGENCLLQGLTTRLTGTLGKDPLFPSLGIAASVGQPAGDGAEIGVSVRRAMIADRRVDSIAKLEAFVEGDVVGVEVEVVAVNGRRQSLTTRSA